jgi:PAS domain S-box-containing protein
MSRFSWQQMSLIERVRWLRYVVPPMLVLVVVLYQLGITQWLERNYGHGFHYGFEIGFYSLLGPAVTLFTLIWVERRLQERERFERQAQARRQQLASLTAVSADAILSLDAQGNITSWNRGAERVLGYLASTMLGRPLTELLPEAEKLAHQLQQRGSVDAFETTAISGTGRTLAVELTQTRLTEVDEGSPASLIIMRDVTARHEREAVRGEERARIARDLHDGVAQTLYFMALKADMARQQLVQQPHQIGAELKEIGQTARQVIREVRRTIFALRPLEWSANGFLPALRQFVIGFAEQVGWQAAVDIDESGLVVPARLEPTIFRLVQESLNNVAKHAHASEIKVRIYQDESNDQLRVEIRDNGRGFEPEMADRQGLGLGQMKTRVKTGGGEFRVDSEPDKGTVISAQFPAAARFPAARGSHE